MDLQFDQEELDLLREVLDAAYRDIRYEVADTNVSTFKDELRQREAAIGAILEKVGGPLPSST